MVSLSFYSLYIYIVFFVFSSDFCCFFSAFEPTSYTILAGRKLPGVWSSRTSRIMWGSCSGSPGFGTAWNCPWKTGMSQNDTMIPSWELTYPLKRRFWIFWWFSFPKVGIPHWYELDAFLLHRTWKWWFGRWFSSSRGLLSGSMLIFQGVRFE